MAYRWLCGTGFIMRKQAQITDDFLSVRMINGSVPDYLNGLGRVVSKHSGEKINLNKYKFRVGSLEDTSYKNNTYILKEWEQFYLKKEMKMQVIGVLENFPCGEDSELVLMVCEDKSVFAYEDERLHLVARSLKDLFESGVQFPGREYRRQSFKNMTKDDGKEVKKSDATGKHQKHQDMQQRQQEQPPSGRSEIKQKPTEEFLSLEYGPQYLEKIGSVVSRLSGAKIHLKKVEKYEFRVGSLEVTSYKNNTDILEEWEQFYLPDEMKMEVIGVLENFPCGEDSAELVIMVCEDGNVFAYEDERLHLVASSLEELFESGVQFPGRKYYYRGQSFENMTEDDWKEVKESPEVKAKFDEDRKMLESLKPTLLKNLRVCEQTQQV